MSRSGLIRSKGAAVTFTRKKLGALTGSTGLVAAPTTESIKGYAMRSAGDVNTYKALELIEQEAITLDFVPKTAGDYPEKDMTFAWGSGSDSRTFSVRSVERVDQAGLTMAARIIGAR